MEPNRDHGTFTPDWINARINEMELIF